MSDPSDQDEPLIAGHGVIVRAANGDVIRYDPSGLVMRLSDRVIEDIRLRLGQDKPPSPAVIRATAEAPDGIDAWNVRTDGEWLRFTARLPGAQGTRGFLRHAEGGAILADAPGAVMGILGIGGPSAALASPGGAAFPQHVVAPADDIGAVGLAGIDTATATDRLEHLRERTHEALVADTLLHWQLEKFAPLPLFVVRVETDASATAYDLAQGRAVENLLIAAANLKSAAALLGKRAKIMAVTLDYALEDTSATATDYRDGMLALMRRIEDGLWALGFDKPLFVSRFATALPEVAPEAALDGQWELSWNHGDHRLIHSAPAYMFARDEYDRPTELARLQMAEMTAAAIAEAATWACPTLYLAELEGATIRVIARGMGDLVLDPDDPFSVGKHAGFALTGCENGAKITKVSIAPDDRQAVLVQCSKVPKGSNLRLAYACAHPEGANAGSLRDGWQMQSATGAHLRRFALPAHLPVTGGRHA